MDMSLSKLWDLVIDREAGVLQSMGLQRVRHDWATELNWTHLGSEPLPNTEEKWFTDERGESLVGHIVTQTQVSEARNLPSRTSSQKMKLIPSIKSWRSGKILNVCTDSWYVYAILHIHRSTWEGRGMLTANNKQVKHGLNILKLLGNFPVIQWLRLHAPNAGGPG